MIRPDQRAVPCTTVEIEVLTELLRDGADNYSIGKRTYRTENTVKTHIKRLMQKTVTNNRTHLAVAIARREIVVLNKAGRVHVF